LKTLFPAALFLLPLTSLAQVRDVDGNVYKTIRIGDQTWMAENLTTSRFRNGDYIQPVTDDKSWSQRIQPAWTFYPREDGPNPAGKLYNFYAVESPKGLCPIGWHVPSDAEWSKLENYLGGKKIAGGKMKEAGTLFWQDKNEVSTTTSGWNAQPGGSRFLNGTFFGFGYLGGWWSATEYGNHQAWSRFIYHFDKDITRNASYKTLGFSVRCLQDQNPSL